MYKKYDYYLHFIKLLHVSKPLNLFLFFHR